MSADKEPFKNNLPIIIAGLLVCLALIAEGADRTFDDVSVLLNDISTEALEVNFLPGMAFAAFIAIAVTGPAIIAALQLFKIKLSAHAQAFILNGALLVGLIGIPARIVSPYAVGYCLESMGCSFCEHRTVRGYRKITKLSWVRYESMCEDEIDLTGLTEAKLQEHLRTEEGALEKAEALGIFLK